MNYLRALCIALIASQLVGCAIPIATSERENIRSIGILNQFSESPTWTIIGTTVFSNRMGQVERRGYKEFLSSSAINYLKGKGYKVRELSGPDLAAIDDIDFVLKIVPWNAYGLVGTYGYGFLGRKFLGLQRGPSAYTVMHIYPYVREGNSFSERRGTYLENFEDLPISEMPDTWDELPANAKYELELALKKCIENSIRMQLSELIN